MPIGTWLIIAGIVLVLLLTMAQPFLTGTYWLGAVLSVAVFAFLDALFSARATPNAPWMMWVVWGIVVGLAMAFWTIAPVYGLRKQRPLILAVPFALMLLVILLLRVLGG